MLWPHQRTVGYPSTSWASCFVAYRSHSTATYCATRAKVNTISSVRIVAAAEAVYLSLLMMNIVQEYRKMK